jgi:hypothetical protein
MTKIHTTNIMKAMNQHQCDPCLFAIVVMRFQVPLRMFDVDPNSSF